MGENTPQEQGNTLLDPRQKVSTNQSMTFPLQQEGLLTTGYVVVKSADVVVKSY